jgi:DNA gyrase subunit A
MRVISRNSAGVRLFNVANNEHVVSAARIEDSDDENEAGAEPAIGTDAGTASEPES